jgi:hypothetical protein
MCGHAPSLPYSRHSRLLVGLAALLRPGITLALFAGTNGVECNFDEPTGLERPSP